MYNDDLHQTLAREIKPLKSKEKIERLWQELRTRDEQYRLRDNQLADLMDAVSDVVIFGATESDMQYLHETHTKINKQLREE